MYYSLKTHYQILGISKQATLAEIKAAYRKLVLLYHPDKNQQQNAAQLFRDIQLAYDILSDKSKREEYDNQLFGFSVSEAKVYYAKKAFQSIKIGLSKRVVALDEPFELIVRTSIPVKDFVLNGIQQFTVVTGPEYFKAGTEVYNSQQTLTQVKYTLKPNFAGYVSIGPACVIYRNIRYESDAIFIKVNEQDTQPIKKQFTKIEKAVYGFAIGAIMLIFLAIVHNIYEYGIKPDEFLTYATPYKKGDFFTLKTGTIPYKLWNVYFDRDSKHQLTIQNKKATDMLVLVVDNETQNIIRNHFVQANSNYTITNLPNGIYYLKIICGQDWNLQKKRDGLQGDFNFITDQQNYNLPKDLIELEQKFENGNFASTNYNIEFSDKK